MPRGAATSCLLLAGLFLVFPAAASAQADLPIYVDRPVLGELTTAHPISDNTYHQHYLYDGRAGERVNVSVASLDFEVAVALYAPGGEGRPLADDGGLEEDEFEWLASVSVTFTAPGRYVVCVHSHQPRRVGEYELFLTNRSTGAAEPR